jgi:hypothetical protein
MRTQKAMQLSLPSFSGPKNIVLTLKNTFEVYLKFLVQFFFLEIV